MEKINRQHALVKFVSLFVIVLLFQSCDFFNAKGANEKPLSQDQTLDLAKRASSYSKSSSSQNAESLEDLVAMAKERQGQLLNLVKSDPGAVLSMAIPKNVRESLPVEVQALVEEEREAHGELLVYYTDYKDKEAELKHFLISKNKKIELVFADKSKPKGLLSGTKVKTKGVFLKKNDNEEAHLILKSEQDLEVAFALDGSSDTSITTQSTNVTALPNTFGEQRTAVFLINHSENPLQPWTREEAQNLVFNDLNNYIKETSLNRTWLTGDVYGYWSVPEKTVDLWKLREYVMTIAGSKGIDLSGYSRWIFISPLFTSQNIRGTGTVGGNPSFLLLNAAFELGTLAHEFGHNLGLKHAGLIACSGDGSTCNNITYGDGFDVMGRSPSGHYNAFNKERLGWLSVDSGDLAVVDTNGIYNLEPYVIAPSGRLKGLKVRRKINPANGEIMWYYVEFRQPIGLDGFVPFADNSGPLIHIHDEVGSDGSHLLDMTPGSYINDLVDSTLIEGATYTELSTGVSITTLSSDASGTSVKVDFSENPVCAKSKAALILEPQNSSLTWYLPGEKVTFSLSVTNLDNVACEPSAFNVSALIPNGWAVESISSENITLNPGSTARLTVSVRSAADTVDGVYNITVNAQNGLASEFNSSETSTLVIYKAPSDCEVSPVSLSLTTTQGRNVEAGTPVSYTGTLTNNNSETCDPTTFEFSGYGNGVSVIAGEGFKLNPGESAPIEFTLISSTDIVDGSYEVNVFVNPERSSRQQSGFTSALVTYNVVNPGAVCVENKPELVLSPKQIQGVRAGTAVMYSATVTNLNNADCEPATFNIYAREDSNFSIGSTSITLASGATGTVNIEASSLLTLSDGSYSLAFYAENSENSYFSDYAFTVYVISNTEPVCDRSNPTISLTPSQSSEVEAGTSVTYSASVSNLDSEACGSSSFTVSANVPGGFSATNSSISLAPGTSGTVNIAVSSSTSTSDGVYSIDVLAQNSQAANYSASGQVNYVVSASQPICERSNPTLTLSPSQSSQVVAGSTVTYSARVSNLDSEACGSSSFMVSANVPSGFSATNTNISLAPGASGTVNIAVSSGASASAGSYNINISTYNSQASSYRATGSVSYIVYTPINNAPVAVNDNVSMSAKVDTIIDALANDYDPENDALRIVSVTQGAKGSVQIRSDGKLLYSPGKRFKDSDSFSYTITDGEKTATATVNLGLTSSDSGGGKGGGKGRK